MVYQYFGTPSGSWSTRYYELARRWVRQGHEVEVITSPYEKSDIRTAEFISECFIEGIKLTIINSSDSNRSGFVKRTVRSLIFALTASFLVLTRSYDVLISSSGPITVGIPSILAHLIKRKKTVFEVRDLWPQGAIELGKIKSSVLIRLFLWFEGKCYKNASLVVACSTDMIKSINDRYPVLNTYVVPNGSDMDLFSKPDNGKLKILNNLYGKKKVIVYTGSLGLMDDGMLMIEAMRLVSNPEIILVILGDGAERLELEAKVRREGINNVEFKGLVSKHEIVCWLNLAQGALVLFKNFSVLQGSSPNKLFDALAAGCPVIHNTTGWIRDLTNESECGIAVSPDQPDMLAQEIEKLCNDDNLRSKMSEKARFVAGSMFNRNHHADEYLCKIKQLLN